MCIHNGFKKGIDSPFIIECNEKFFFCGTEGDYKEMQERCKYIKNILSKYGHLIRDRWFQASL